jgi:phosphoheptose isomerase
VAAEQSVKSETIEKFEENADLVARASKALTEVLKKEPDAILIGYESQGKVGVCAIPGSYALARGLSEMLYDLLHPAEEEEDD